MNIQIFGVVKCKDTQKTIRFFKERGIELHFVDLKQKAITKGELRNISNSVKLEDLIDGWTLVREWGQQGRAGRVKKDHFDNRDAAEAALIRVRDTQLNRGFKVVFMQGQDQPA